MFHIGAHPCFVLIQKFFEQVHRHFVAVTDLHFEAGPNLLGGIAPAFRHFNQRLQVVPHVQGFGQWFDLAQRPLEELAYQNGFARQRIFDLCPQAMFGGQVFVGASAGDIFAIVPETAREFRVGVDLQHEQVTEGKVGNIQVEAVTALIHTDLHAAHRQVDARHQVLAFHLPRHLFRRRGLTRGEQPPSIQRFELLAGGRDDAFDRFGETACAHGRPVVVAKAHAPADKVVGDLQIVVVRAIQVGQIHFTRIREREVADRIVFGEDDRRASILDLGLHRRGSTGGNKERRERPQQTGGCDIELRFEIIQMLVTALAGGEVHEVPGEERVGQGDVGMDAGSGKGIAVQVHALFEVTALGQRPIAGNGLVPDIGEEQQITMPVMQAFTEIHPCAMQGVHQGGFHQAGFVHRTARRVIWAGGPFDHPVEDFKLAELLLPTGEALGAQIIHERMLAGPGAHRQ